ncbi:hypothetical protein EMCRGX_G006018 [Ephydatia muelleri]
MRPDSTDVPTICIYWRVNGSFLDGALLLDFIIQGSNWPTPTKVEKVLGSPKNLAAKLSCTTGVYAT